MPPASWNVEDALNQVIVAIKTGAGTFKMEAGTETGLKKGYRDDFEERRRAGVEWKDVEAKILALALTVGATAALFTTIKSSSASGTLDENLTYTAAWLIAQSSRECGKAVMTGGFCRRFPTPLGLTKDEVDSLLRASGLFGPLLGLMLGR